MAEFRGRLLLKRRSERAICGALAERLRLVPPRIERAVTFFSGGNQQKVVLAKGLTRSPRLLIMEETTTGADVGAQNEVYDHMKRLLEREDARNLKISHELPEPPHQANLRRD